MSTRRAFLLHASAGLTTVAGLSIARAATESISTNPNIPMKTYKVPHTELVVSRIAYGSGFLGGDTWSKAPPNADIVDQATRLVQTAYSNGITLFDLADVYGYGAAETAFGEALKRIPGLRDKIVIQSKCGIRWENEPTGSPRRMDFSRAHIASSVEGSLRRIGTDRLDILLLHHPDPLVQPEEVAQVFDDLHRSGKVRYFGLSNHTARQMELLRKYIRQPLVINQVPIGLARPHLLIEGMHSMTNELLQLPEGSYSSRDTGVIDHCRLSDILVQAYSPLRGLPLRPLPADATAEARQFAQTLREIARQKKTAPAAVALAWLLAHPAGILPITEPRNPEHLIENCTADSVTLSREEWYALLIATGGISPTTMKKTA